MLVPLLQSQIDCLRAYSANGAKQVEAALPAGLQVFEHDPQKLVVVYRISIALAQVRRFEISRPSPLNTLPLCRQLPLTHANSPDTRQPSDRYWQQQQDQAPTSHTAHKAPTLPPRRSPATSPNRHLCTPGQAPNRTTAPSTTTAVYVFAPKLRLPSRTSPQTAKISLYADT
ncbi:hypothetical protein P153DRAFT_388882 [Dothidotthia symphoricarpi CBS 119687]|uniref:Uncharacterized protein n=1 Tax=Dothidotthia symphoricarpi CBS 119687 TaxID=1392245 RepID=A0A6A6A5F8_9PLEO|nr:uncharacterized protein P153DRAFT_388882 [Dothidotthia symphoricarpi CBS 119687]KAF2126137.1 hypothetical protein P153DRAFT_388882 [Dothidotthia symphoricarpi CBS 119687]